MRTALAVAFCALAGMAGAHDGVVHKDAVEAARHRAETALPPLGPPTALPFDVGGAYALTDQWGAARDQADPDGRYQLLFFGYANCPSICAVAMPLMADVTTELSERGVAVRPVMITVDPKRDTVDNMDAPLADLHPEFVGLTGSEAELQVAYDAFGVEIELAFTDPEYGDVFAHGSHIYLMDGTGEVLTIIPPILDAGRVSDIVANYALNGGT
ncbi:MAG: SCO family protein [Paracoccaceae bacterium]